MPAPIATGTGLSCANCSQYWPRSFARDQKPEPAVDGLAVAGVPEFFGVTEAGAEVAGEEELAELERGFDGEAAEPALFVGEPAAEFELPAAFEDVEFEFAADVFVFPFLLAAAFEFVLPGFDFELELANAAAALSRADEEFLLLAGD
jgi:hypothetical protein